MAGIGPIWESVRKGSWPRCHDGSLLQPLDVLYLLFSNKGYNSTSTGFNVCFVAHLHIFPPLRNMLPTPTAYFTPDHFVDGLVTLFIASIVVTIGIFLVKTIWFYFHPEFRSIKPPHKQWYVVANLSKSFFLGSMALSSRYWIYVYHFCVLDNMDTIYVKRCAILYVATDLVALFMVPKLPRSTILHHVTTTTLIIMVTAVNLETKGYGGLLGVSKMVILYGIFSTIPYLVNAYLALRVVYPKAWWLLIVVKLSLWTYIFCCICNWSFHLIWLVSLILNTQLSVFNVLYFSAMSMMVNDDIVLIKWLMKRSSPILEEPDYKKGDKSS